MRAFAIYLRVANAVSFERLSQLMSDLVGLKISEGALVNMLAASQPAFARAAALIHPAIGRDRHAGGQAKLVGLGVPS